MGFLESLEASGVGVWVRESYFGYPIVLAAHSIGMGVVVGVVLMLSLRVLGYARRISVTAFDDLLTIAWLGFALNAASGVMLFVGNATRLAQNAPFLLKLAFIVAGGISVWALWRSVGPGGREISDSGVATPVAKAIALTTIAFWLAAILAGRLIGYTIQYF